jgi:glycosyltransferase involved in cell wall biosynthesis
MVFFEQLKRIKTHFAMANNPLVSIIMNCYNSDRFLREAIDSVYAQTYKNWEIVFWDNASDDKSGEIAQSYDEKIKYFRAESTTPLGEARNLAMQEAEGTYIAFLDCDDLYEPDKLQKQIELLEANDFAMCYGGVRRIDESGRVIKRLRAKNRSGYLFGKLLKRYEINMQSVMVRSSIMKELSLNFHSEYKYCPDHNLFMQIAANNRIGVIRDYIVRYRAVEKSLTQQSIDIVSEEIKRTLDNLVTTYPKLYREFISEFDIAYQKLNFYDAVAALVQENKKQARMHIRKVFCKRIEYIMIYLLLLSPLSPRKILKILGR